MIVVYSKPKCVQCEFTKNYLKEHDVVFVEKDITASNDNLEEAKKTGFSMMPIVVSDTLSAFSGFRIDLLEKLV